MSSIRRFLIIILVATITLFNFVAALQGYRAGLNKAEELFDRQLIAIAHLLSSARSNSLQIISSEKKDDIALQVWTDAQTLIQRSENSPDTLITPLQEGFNYANFNGYRWRTYVFRDNENHQWMILAERTDSRYTLAEQVIVTSILPIVIGLPVVALLIWIIIGGGLRPLSNLAFQLRQKKPQDLSPLENKNIPEELSQLVTSTNDLLGRLSSSFEREKRFSGDAAHELRTPLSIIKIQLFNLRQAMPEQKEALDIISNSVDRMAHLIEQMLTLYRMTPEQFAANFQSVDLHAIAQRTLIDEYQKIDSKHQKISLDAKSCKLIGDEFALQTLVKNLVDNASKYTPEHGEIAVSIQENENSVLLSVADSGPGIPENLRERVFERFYRVDGDQHNSMVMGCGLGLSIVKHIVDLHHGKIVLRNSTFKSGLLVEVTLPKTQDFFSGQQP